MCEMFGGPSAAEESTLGQTSALSTSLLSNYRQQYSQQQDVLGKLQSQISRIQSGQTGPGFSGEENAARQSMIINTGAATARNAIQASRSVGAGTVGALTSGINQQVEGQIEAATGARTSNALLQEQAENFGQGRQNAVTTASALQALSNAYNPAQYASEAGGSLGAQFKEASQIQKEKIARSQAIAGLVEKVGMGAATFGMGGLSALGSGESFGEGAGDFFKGGMNETFGTNFGLN